jgi:DNA-binding SARP family transcriptional activator
VEHSSFSNRRVPDKSTLASRGCTALTRAFTGLTAARTTSAPACWAREWDEMVKSDVRVELLGPLRLAVDGAAVEVPGPKRRAVLALLALAEGRTVPVADLVDALWPSEMPHAARQALHTHISRLRACLGSGAARLQTRQDGYRLDLGSAELDVAHARGLLATARNGAGSDPVEALTLLREAHALWRGPVLADLTDVAPIAAAVEGCDRLLRDVTDALITAAVDAGRSDDVVGLAVAAHDAEPLREPAVLLLMRTLAATGQAAEALRVGHDYRAASTSPNTSSPVCAPRSGPWPQCTIAGTPASASSPHAGRSSGSRGSNPPTCTWTFTSRAPAATAAPRYSATSGSGKSVAVGTAPAFARRTP